ncbi:MAG: serine/threonine protein kinase, partial [Myxococcales bacterium]
AELHRGDVVGEYRVESKLGEGGFGAVYGAVHPLIGKAAAIKVLHRQYSSSPQMVGRFAAEARAVNQIRHRNIIDIFSFGALPDGRQYYVMELLEGMTFDRFLDERGPLPPAVALPILRQMARALDAAHAAGIAHRDLKPENIFLVMDGDGDIFPKLLDFGIAKLLHDDASPESGSVKTRTGTPMGTPYYMSPEQCRGHNVDHRTDIYSFGVMTFKVLTGQVPFDAPAVVELLYRHLSETPPLPSSVRPELGTTFDAPVQRMLEKDPARRPPTVTAAVDGLIEAALAAGLSVPLPPGYSPGSMSSFPRLPISQSRPSGDSVASQTPATLVTPGARSERPAGRRGALPALALAALGGLALLGLGVGWVQHSRAGVGFEVTPALECWTQPTPSPS